MTATPSHAKADTARAEAPAASAAPMYIALVGVGLACGSLIAGAYEATAPVIAESRAEALERAIFEVLPGATQSATFVSQQDGTFAPSPAELDGPRVHAAYDDHGELLGMAVEASAMGYQDEISLLYGYELEAQAVVGMVVLDSRETPGLGDKIDSDPQFRENFRQLDVRLNDTGEALRHPVEIVAPGKKTAPYQLDTITGATISSSAVGRILRDSTAQWIARLSRRRGDFERGNR